MGLDYIQEKLKTHKIQVKVNDHLFRADFDFINKMELFYLLSDMHLGTYLLIFSVLTSLGHKTYFFILPILSLSLPVIFLIIIIGLLI